MKNLNSLLALKNFSVYSHLTSLLIKAHLVLLKSLKEEYKDSLKYNDGVLKYIDDALDIEKLHMELDNSGLSSEEYCKKNATKLVNKFMKESNMFVNINKSPIIFLEFGGGFFILK